MLLKELVEKGKLRLTLKDFESENDAKRTIEKGWIEEKVDKIINKKFYIKICKEMIKKLEDESFDFDQIYFFEELKAIRNHLKYVKKYNDGTYYLVR